MTYALAAIFLLVSLLMIMIILLQRGRGGGIAAAFSGGGGGGTAFGTKTGDVFTTATVILFAIFLLMAIGLNYRWQNEKEVIPGSTPAQPAAATLPAATSQPSDLPAMPTRLPDNGEPIAPPMAPVTTAPFTAAPTTAPAK